MRKGTIFKYEIKRLLRSKEYLLFLAATLAFCVSLLRSLVLFGANYTAPFSELTFSTYCSSLMPFLFVLLLVLCARQARASERGAEALIQATPLPLPVFRLLRYSAIACAFMIAAALPMAVCFLFYRLVFDYTAVGALLGLGLLLLLPPTLLLFGAAMLLGNKSAAGVFVLLAAMLIISVFQVSLPAALDIFGSAAVQAPDTGTSGFALTPAFVAGRVIFSGIGLALILVSLFQPSGQRT